MAEAHIGPIPEGLKECPVCAEPISIKACKCIHCESELGPWRRRLGLSSTLLALLVALISVLTASVPVVRDALTAKNSDLIFSYQGVNRKAISILASNTGARPGSVWSAYLHITQNNSIGLKIEGTDSAKLIEPGKSALITLVRDQRGRFSDEDKDDRYVPKCFVFLISTDFAGKEGFHKVFVDCPKLLDFETP